MAGAGLSGARGVGRLTQLLLRPRRTGLEVPCGVPEVPSGLRTEAEAYLLHRIGVEPLRGGAACPYRVVRAA
jgi:hypothetical protein